jgi:hypothetical protein
MFAVEPKPDCPNLLRLKRAFRDLQLTRTPGTPIFDAHIEFRMSHSHLFCRPSSAEKGVDVAR